MLAKLPMNALLELHQGEGVIARNLETIDEREHQLSA